MRNPQGVCVLPILALANVLMETSGSALFRPVLTGPTMAYLGSRVHFRCNLPGSSSPITYELVKDGDHVIHVTEHQGDQPTSFAQRVALSSEGTYHCNAKTNETTGISNSITLIVVTPASNTKVTSDPSPPVVFNGSRLVLSCTVSRGSHLYYTWYFNRTEVTSSTYPPMRLAGNQLVVDRVTPAHAGAYYCMAWSLVHDTRRISSSLEFEVKVKVHVSKPEISFSMSKEGTGYHGNVTCQSSSGTPPVNFTLSVDDTEVGSVTTVGSLSAWFYVALAPGVVTGVARCLVKNEAQELTSDPLTLEVVPVGGDVRLEVEYLYRADSKLAGTRMSCIISRGTFPFFSWFLNNSLLPPVSLADSTLPKGPDRPRYAFVDGGRILVLAGAGSEESGYYHCRARDSYDHNGSWVESSAVLVQFPDAFMATTEVITLLFACFFLLSVALGIGCMYRMADLGQGVAAIPALAVVPPPTTTTASEPPMRGKQDDPSVERDENDQVCRRPERGKPADHEVEVRVNNKKRVQWKRVESSSMPENDRPD